MPFYSLTRRGHRLLGILSLFLLVYLRWRWHTWHEMIRPRHNPLPDTPEPQFPPLYEQVRARENSLPHYEEYKVNTVKYFLDANHARNSGWGNVMQDFVMMGLLAYATNRSFVFNDYVWNPDGSLYSEYNGKQIPSRIPLSAFLGGPIVGGSWPTSDRTPLSVSRNFFHDVCPNPTMVQTSDINTEEVRFSDHIPASYLFDKWVEKINSIDDPCLMLDPNSNKIYDFWIYGHKRMLSIWPYLSKSPLITRWDWSPLVHDAFKRNLHLFEPEKTFFRWLFSFQGKNNPLVVPGLLAIHVRRGDFEDHCVHLAKWSADWNAFNSFPEFRDKFDRAAAADGSITSDEKKELYLRRCYPTIEQIVDRVSQVRKEAAGLLRYLYIMTNGPTEWVEELKSALKQNMSWDHVGSSRDLELTRDEKFVAQALDMYVAQRSEVFVGNGWSSFTSNVVMLRMAQGFDPNANRFW